MTEESLKKAREANRRYYAAHREEMKARSRKYRAENLGPEKDRERNLRKLYGIALPQFEMMELRQGGLCAICKQKRKLCIDHKHGTKNIRGLLCSKCNVGLGMFQDDFSVLIRAADYIRQNGGLR